MTPLEVAIKEKNADIIEYLSSISESSAQLGEDAVMNVAMCIWTYAYTE